MTWLPQAPLLSLGAAAARSCVLALAMALILALGQARRAATRVFCWMAVLYASFAFPLLTFFTPRLTWTLPHRLWPHLPARIFAGLAAIYLTGVVFLLARIVAGWATAQRLLRQAAAIDHPGALAELRARAASIGLERPPALCESASLQAPMTAGVRRPAVILPAGWHAWPPETMRSVLAHELAHVARGDALTQRIALVYRALFWFNPLGWWLAPHLADLAELASDEFALGAGADRAGYAEALLGFFTAVASGRVHWQALSMAHGRPERRIRRILNWRGGNPGRLAETRILGLALVTIPLAMLIAAVQPVAAVPPPPAVPLSHPAPLPKATLPRVAAATPSPLPGLLSAPSPALMSRPLDPGLPVLPPIPADPWELTWGPVTPLTDPTLRARVEGQLDVARNHLNLYLRGTPPFDLEVGIESLGHGIYAGPGRLSEFWYGNLSQWTATMNGTNFDRIHYQQHIWSRNDTAPVPLQLQLARVALLSPIPNTGSGDLVAAPAVLDGVALTCTLFSGGRVPPIPIGRAWQQQEYCVENESGRLRLFSPAPGLYGLYDYNQGPVYYGHDYPRSIEFHEAGEPMLRLQVKALDSAPAADPQSFAPTTAMLAQGLPDRLQGTFLHITLYFHNVSAALLGPNAATQVVVVYAVIDSDGNVLEADALQRANPALAAQALRAVRRRNFGVAEGTQRQVLVECVYQPEASQ